MAYFSPEQFALLLEQGARAIEISRAHLRPRLVQRNEWLSADEGGTMTRKTAELLHHPDVFPAWADPQVRAACEKVFESLEPSSRVVSFGSLGMFGFDSAFRIVARLVDAAPGDATPEYAALSAVACLESEMLAPSLSGLLYAPLPGMTMPADASVVFPGGVVLRVTTVDDLNRSHARDIEPPPPACLVVSVEQPRLSGAYDASKDVALQSQNAIQRAKRALSVFKTGRIGESFIETRVGERATRGGNLSWSTFGHYVLKSEDVEPLKRIAERLEEPSWPGLDFACERLVDAERRWQERDSILDAVIGLEGLLLSTGSREGLRYRFAIHAASMLPLDAGQHRRRRYREAYDLYQVRSDLAHTGMNAKGYDIGGETLAAGAVVQKAKDLLREAVHAFLLHHHEEVPKPKDKQQRYWRDYWERRIFGIAPSRPF